MKNRQQWWRTETRTVSAAIALLFLSGCFSYQAETNTVNRSIQQEGLLTQIELGATTTEWLLEKFGAPQAVRRPSPSQIIWQYENVEHTKRAMRALPLFAITLENSAATVYNFEVENDYIVKYWRD